VAVKGVLKVLGLNRANYYNLDNLKEQEREERDQELLEKIKQIYYDSMRIYGAPKITRELRKLGEKVSQKKVGQLMRLHGIKAHYIKQYKRTSKDSDFAKELKNILKRDFQPVAPNTVWCTDITYIWTGEDEFVYLTSIMDLYSRKIISWTLSRNMEVEEVLKCLEEAKERRHMDKALIIHTDRGRQFTSKRFKELTAEIMRSYSRKGNPWDNACIESFHALIKREWLNQFRIENYQHAKHLIFEYIEGFYNTRRSHSHCDYLSPNEFEKEYRLKAREAAKKAAQKAIA
jgi:transposase InsO family protein